MALGNKVMDERIALLAEVASQLYGALELLQRARASNTAFALGLELPPERPLIEAIHACARARDREKT